MCAEAAFGGGGWSGPLFFWEGTKVSGILVKLDADEVTDDFQHSLTIEGCDEEQVKPPKDKPKPIKELGGALKMLWSDHCILRTWWNDFFKLG